MSEWLELMLEEISRKRREAVEAAEENSRRSQSKDDKPAPRTDQSK